LGLTSSNFIGNPGENPGGNDQAPDPGAEFQKFFSKTPSKQLQDFSGIDTVTKSGCAHPCWEGGAK
jgi:hypothetical protein